MKKILILLVAVVMVFCVTGCDNSKKMSKKWNKNEYLKLLSEPEVEYAFEEVDNGVSIDLKEATRTNVLDYVEAVKDKGFIIDASTSDFTTGYTYSAKNESETHLVTITFSDSIGKVVIEKVAK